MRFFSRICSRLICLIKGHDPRTLGPYLIYQDQSEVWYEVCARCETTTRKWVK
jgi:hypothetical protein